MSITIINYSQIWVAGLGDCKVTMHTSVGKSHFQKNHLDLSRNHSPIDGLSREEDLRKNKNGFIF
jgi:hypothetical protein